MFFDRPNGAFNKERLQSAAFIDFSNQLNTFNQTLQLRESALIEEHRVLYEASDHWDLVEHDVSPTVGLALNRAKRILALLQKIAAQFTQDNRDHLNDTHLGHLTKIAQYTGRCLPEKDQLQIYLTYISFDEIEQYKFAADSISELSNTYQQLAGCVLQVIGGVILTSLLVASIYLSLGLSLSLVLGLTGICSEGFGTYLNQRNAYNQLSIDVSKTLNSAACDRNISCHVSDDPDCGFLMRMMS